LPGSLFTTPCTDEKGTYRADTGSDNETCPGGGAIAIFDGARST